MFALLTDGAKLEKLPTLLCNIYIKEKINNTHAPQEIFSCFFEFHAINNFAIKQATCLQAALLCETRSNRKSVFVPVWCYLGTICEPVRIDHTLFVLFFFGKECKTFYLIENMQMDYSAACNHNLGNSEQTEPLQEKK